MLPVAYVLLLHNFAFLSTDAIQIQDQSFGQAKYDIFLWGIIAMSGFGLFGVLVTLRFPNGRGVVPAWSLVFLSILVSLGMVVLFILGQGSSIPNLADTSEFSSKPGILAVKNWMKDLYLPVTLLICLSGIVQRTSRRPHRGIWQWIGFAIGVVPYLVATVLLMLSVVSFRS